MGMSLKSGEGDDDLGEVSEINVTPFIDVVLVLLIIFMVAAPLSTVDVAVDLPSSNAPPAERQGEPVYLTLKRDLSLALGEETVPAESLSAALDRETGGNREERVYLRADEAVAYGELMETMNALRTAGYLKIALVGLESVPQGGAAASPAPAPAAAPTP